MSRIHILANGSMKYVIEKVFLPQTQHVARIHVYHLEHIGAEAIVATDRVDPGAPSSGPLLTGSSLLAALSKAREDDERHHESRQDRPDQIMLQQVGAIRGTRAKRSSYPS
nr:hypothetical protein [Tanacetum cinerariifolium]